MGLKAVASRLGGGSPATFSSLTVTNLTAGRVPFISTGGLFVDSSTFTYSASTGLLLTTPITTSSTIAGLNLEVFKTASADSPLTAAQAAGTIVSNFGMTDADCTIALPTAAAGYSFLAILPAVRPHFFKFQAGASDKIYLSGTAGSDNGNVGVASGYATGVCCSFFTFKASDGGYDWYASPLFGAWVAS